MSPPITLMRLCVATAVVAALGASAGCSSADDAAASEDELSYELFPTTKVLSAADLAGLVSSPDGTLTFATAPASLADLAEGNVVLASLSAATPTGLLRYVTAFEREGSKLTIHTMQAAIPLAFRRLHVRSQRDITGFGSKPWTTNDLSPRTLRPRGELIGGDASAEQPLNFCSMTRTAILRPRTIRSGSMDRSAEAFTSVSRSTSTGARSRRSRRRSPRASRTPRALSASTQSAHRRSSSPR